MCSLTYVLRSDQDNLRIGEVTLRYSAATVDLLLCGTLMPWFLQLSSWSATIVSSLYRGYHFCAVHHSLSSIYAHSNSCLSLTFRVPHVSRIQYTFSAVYRIPRLITLDTQLSFGIILDSLR